MIATELPQAGYTVRESEKLLGVSSKYLYKLVREGKVSAYSDSVGQLRISPFEVYRLRHEKEASMS